jgi:ribosome modulation factor
MAGHLDPKEPGASAPNSTGKAGMYAHPFNEGRDARESGKSEYDCPYLGADWRRAAWMHGWEYAEERLPPVEDN